MATLNPRQAGGIVPIEPTPFAISQMTPNEVSDLLESDSEEEDSDSEEEEEVGVPKVVTKKEEEGRKLGKGEGRIVRDPVTGKVLRIVLGGEGEDGEDVTEEVKERVEGESESDDDDEDSDDEEVERSLAGGKDEKNPWGEAMEVWSGEESEGEELDLGEDFGLVGPRSVGQGIPIGMGKGMGRRKVVGKTEVVRRE